MKMPELRFFFALAILIYISISTIGYAATAESNFESDADTTVPRDKQKRRSWTMSHLVGRPNAQTSLHRTVQQSWGQVAMSDACCVSSASGRVDCFFRSSESTVHQVTILDGGEKAEFTDLGGRAVGDVACLARPNNVLDVFILRDNHKIAVKTSRQGSWNEWIALESTYMEVPSCYVLSNAESKCLARKQDLTMQTISATRGGWSEGESPGGLLMGPIGGIFVTRATPEAFAVRTDGHVYHNYFIREGLTGWKKLTKATAKGRPTVTSWSRGRLDVFVLTIENTVLHKGYDGRWLKESDLGGLFVSEPSCISTGVGTIYCFAIGTNTHMYLNVYQDDIWTGWTKSQGGLIGSPSCVKSGEEKLACFVRSDHHELVRIEFSLT